jgi:hypothetical protein
VIQRVVRVEMIARVLVAQFTNSRLLHARAKVIRALVETIASVSAVKFMGTRKSEVSTLMLSVV